MPRKDSATPVDKAVWFIESHGDGEITLDDIAAAAEVSRYHLSRAFGLVTGYSVMQYLRARRLELNELDLASPPPDDDLLALDEALSKLEAEDPVKADLVKLRFFAGLTVEQAATALGISRATADRYWSFARAWLFHEIGASE